MDTAEIAADARYALNSGIIDAIQSAPAGAEVEVAHSLSEGHDKDYGTSQTTYIAVRVDDTWVARVTYSLPAEPDDDGLVYWRAFEAADSEITTELESHGVDCAGCSTFGTGWSVTFPRSTWTA